MSSTHSSFAGGGGGDLAAARSEHPDVVALRKAAAHQLAHPGEFWPAGAIGESGARLSALAADGWFERITEDRGQPDRYRIRLNGEQPTRRPGPASRR